jgi:hypothetical protein
MRIVDQSYGFFLYICTCYTCAHPISTMTCVSSTRQNPPGSTLFFFLSPAQSVSLCQLRSRLNTIRDFSPSEVNKRRTRFSHLPVSLCQLVVHAEVEEGCTASYALPLYATRTSGLSQTPFWLVSGLSACIRQHSDPSRWCVARLSGIPRNCSGDSLS